MATAQSPLAEKKWITLNDPNGAQLKVGTFRDKLVLVISGVAPRSTIFSRVVSELGFSVSAKGGYLYQAKARSDKIFPAQFHAIWPQAGYAMMHPDMFRLDLEGKAARLARQQAQSQAAPDSDLAQRVQTQEGIAATLAEATYLGRNERGERVFNSLAGRFYVVENGDKQEFVYQTQLITSPLFLEARTESEIRQCARGLILACEKGEAQNKDKLNEFAQTVLGKSREQLSAEDITLVARAIDSAVLESLVENNSQPAEAWADASYIDEMMIGRAEFAPDMNVAPFIPAPIAVQIQRFIGSASSVYVQGKIPGIGFGLLPESTTVYVRDPETLAWGNSSYHRPFVQGVQQKNELSDGGYCRVSRDTPAEEIQRFFSELSQNAMCVMTSGTPNLGARVSGYAEVLQSIKVPPWLSHTEFPIYIYVMQAGAAGDQSKRDQNHATITSWNDLKSLVDETLLVLRKEEAQVSNSLNQEREENRYQRPYRAFSKTGAASTMVPKNLQSGLGVALSNLEQTHGPIDQFVSDELGLGAEVLASIFSPEQIDAVALAINRIQKGRAFILGDETGIGKGRTLAAVASWASKMNKQVIFMTDKSNLFSDLARDLKDIGEWDRFRPLITNTDGQVLDIMADAQVLATPPTASEMKAILAGKEHNYNIIFTTYSQINKKGNDKHNWLLNQAQNALLIADESHVAAGSDSNVANNVQELVENSWGALYSSATWAKSSKNLHIYSRALPESVNITQVTSNMKDDGESFGEVFSTMLAMDGAFIRREHDLSKIDFVMVEDQINRVRNERVTNQLGEILAMMAMVSGEINHALQRMSAGARRALHEAKLARDGIVSASVRADNLARANRARLEISIGAHTQQIEVLTQVMQSQAQLVTEATILEFQDTEQLAASIRSYQTLYGQTLYGQTPAQETTDRQVIPPDEIARHQYALTLTEMNKRTNELELARAELAELGPEQVAQETPAIRQRIFTSSFGTGGAIYEVFRRAIAALSVDHTAQAAIVAHEQGKRPVIVFEETGEAFVRQLIREECARIETSVQEMRSRQASGETSDQDTLTQELAMLLDAGTKTEDLVREVRAPTIQDLLLKLLERLGGVKITDPGIAEIIEGTQARLAANGGDGGQIEPDDNGSAVDTEDEASTKSELEIIQNITELPGIDQATVDTYMNGMRAIQEKITLLPKLAIVTVDVLRAKMQAAGLTVGEISGRNYQLVPSNPDNVAQGLCQLKKRARKKTDITQTVRQFNSAEIDAVIINKAAATGVSLHSSPRFADSRQRVLLEMQADENPTNRIQLYGRVNRFDQVVPPVIQMMTLGLRSEMRAKMVANKKLINLSANIRSSRENAAIMQGVPDLYNKIGDRVCQEYLLENPGIASRLGIAMTSIQSSAGAGHTLTRNATMLQDRDSDKVYEDLSLAYDDAVIESTLNVDGNFALDRNWGAATFRQTHAWGPTNNLEVLSAFDSPVYVKQLKFTQDYQPMHWKDVREVMIGFTQKLLTDDRVRPLAISSRTESWYARSKRDLQEESRLSEQEKSSRWTRDLLFSLVRQADREALDVEEALDLFADEDVEVDEAGNANVTDDVDNADDADVNANVENEVTTPPIDEAVVAQEESDPNDLLVSARVGVQSKPEPVQQFTRKPKGFESMAGSWMAASARIPGTSLNARVMCLISRSGKTAKLWYLEEENQARQFLMNITLGRETYTQPSVKFVKELPRLEGVDADHWLSHKMNDLFNSTDREIPRVSLLHLSSLGARVLEAKEAMALISTEFTSIEEALAHPEHNAVKESFYRKMFLEKIIGQMHIGDGYTIVDRHERVMNEFDSLVLSGVTLPKSGEESLLSRWKFHFVQPGAEKPITMSGSLLYRLSGGGPSFSRLHISQSVFDPEARHASYRIDRFDRFPKGLIQRDRAVLVGNMFQAQDWARTTKRGRPIIYTDETGARHRAIELDANSFADSKFPTRLHHRDMIKSFFSRLFNDPVMADLSRGLGSTGERGIQLYTSFKAVLSRKNDLIERDTMFLDTSAKRLAWFIDKEERKKVQRSLRSAVTADKKLWHIQFPDQPYPVVYQAESNRAKGKVAPLHIRLPDTQDGIDRFIDIFVKSQGLQIFTSNRQLVTAHAKAAEQEFYENMAAPEIERQRRMREIQERRARTREMFNAVNYDHAHGSGGSGAAPVVLPSEFTQLPAELTGASSSEGDSGSVIHLVSDSLDSLAPRVTALPLRAAIPVFVSGRNNDGGAAV